MCYKNRAARDHWLRGGVVALPPLSIFVTGGAGYKDAAWHLLVQVAAARSEAIGFRGAL